MHKSYIYKNKKMFNLTSRVKNAFFATSFRTDECNSYLQIEAQPFLQTEADICFL